MKRLVVIAAVVPVLGLGGLVLKAELAVRSGPTWTLPISGYDPRDLLHGHYLRYRFDLDLTQPAPSCGGDQQPEPGCCLCLTGPKDDPIVQQIDCDDREVCDGWLHSAELAPPLRYFVPEDAALDLEQALRVHATALQVTTTPAGTAAIGELTLEGRPWREIVTP